MNLVQIHKKNEKLLEIILTRLLAIFFTVACILYASNLIMRTALSMRVAWIDPLVQYLFVLSGLMGAAYAVKSSENIKIELFRNLANKKPVKILRVSVSIIITCIILYVFTAYLKSEYSMNISHQIFHIPTWVLAVPYIFLFLVSLSYYTTLLISAITGVEEDNS
jgi:TRAP-type C4-dicarboxylate transport system permease small subunit